ncbi:hypothetical protein [Helicobacter pullorum]|uniref:hypothetical protein n=1 Tax=Helicobacter pullorum TaxID=35818 RepID=UPI001066CC33|nr:hypothetical protein [Helicobacter pullorum]HJF82534.1 hypothetical protein [Helicobacter pullorum]
MNDNLKCDRFYSKNKNEFVTIDECNSKPEYIISNCSNDIFCPECRVAELYFVSNMNTSHLRTKRNALHNPNCYCNYKATSNEVVQDFINSLTNKRIQNKLGSMMRYLFYQNNNLAPLQESLDCTNSLLVESHKQQDSRRTMQVIRRKSLNSSFFLDDMDNICAFYDKAMLNLLVGDKGNGTYAYLKIYINDKMKFQINVSKNIPNDIDNGKMYNIVIIGNINKPSQGEVFSSPFTIKLLKSNCLKYKKHKEC